MGSVRKDFFNYIKTVSKLLYIIYILLLIMSLIHEFVNFNAGIGIEIDDTFNWAPIKWWIFSYINTDSQLNFN